jgi:hypothetical protein
MMLAGVVPGTVSRNTWIAEAIAKAGAQNG